MARINELSVFFPTYNEEGNIENVTLRTKEVLEKVAEKWEIIIVDDGSSDSTPKIADKLAKSDKRISVVHHLPNRGYGGALKSGFEKANYEWVAFIDSDGQFDFGEIEKFIDEKDNADLILGYRKTRADSFARKLFTFGWAALARILMGLNVRDYSCGFKMIKKEVYEKVLPLVGEEKVTQIELLVKARKMGFAFAEVGVNHYPRASGKQTGANLKVVVKSVFDLIKLWWLLANKTEVFLLLVILGVGAFLRLYKIDEYLTFLGDEGRDAIVVRRLLVNFDPILVGPGTSIGNMYLGPLYYYMMAPALLLANFSPVGPAVMIALLGVVTIFFVWFVAREWFSRPSVQGPTLHAAHSINIGALVAAGLYAVSPTVIVYSRSSWNPNIMPFFALLSIYSIWRVWSASAEASARQGKWLIVLGISYAFVLQSHYLGLLLAPVLLLFWTSSFINLRLTGNWKRVTNSKIVEIGNFAKNSLLSLGIFAILMSPLVIFDARHGWRNFEAIRKFFGERQTTVSFRPWTGLGKIYPIFEKVNIRLLAGKNEVVGKIVTISLVIGLFWLLLIRREEYNDKKVSAYFLLFLWLGLAFLGLSLYKQEIYDHYYGFFFAAPFLLVGGLAEEIVMSDKKQVTRAVFFLVLGSLLFVNLLNSPLRFPPNRQLQRSQEVTKKISEESRREKFNLAVLAERNYEDGYQYFLEKDGLPVIEIDAQKPETFTEQLFVVCEMPVEKCDPTHSPKAEVANFGWSKIENQWEVSGVRLLKLVHATD